MNRRDRTALRDRRRIDRANRLEYAAWRTGDRRKSKRARRLRRLARRAAWRRLAELTRTRLLPAMQNFQLAVQSVERSMASLARATRMPLRSPHLIGCDFSSEPDRTVITVHRP